MRSVRAQMIGSMVVLLGCGLAVSGVLTYRVQFEGVDDRVSTDLTQEIREFEEVARRGVDPQSGERFTDLDQVLAVGVDNSYPEAHLSLIGVVDGVVTHVQSGTRDPVDVTSEPDGPLDLTQEPQAVEEMVAAPRGVVGITQTSRGEAWFLTTRPLLESDDRQALFVALYLVGPERAEVTGSLPGLVLVYTIVILVVAVAGWLVGGRLLAPLRDLSTATQQISDDNPSLRVEVRGSNEVSQLGRRFNSMLDRLEQALASQRNLLNDVSHELRTPLTIVRGHLDLLDPDDQRDVVATRALVIDELDRMSRLVDDLMTLAKSERPDFVEPGLVDLTLLTDEVAERLIALADRQWRIDAVAEGLVALDRDRIVQALLALASNAVRHTETDDVVAVGTARVTTGSDPHPEPRLHLWIRDSGPGVDPEDVEKIFERFGRGSTEDSHSGTGLGLSIVQAIARGHGGQLRLDNRPGDGATFVLDLPWVPAASGPGVEDDSDPEARDGAEATHSATRPTGWVGRMADRVVGRDAGPRPGDVAVDPVPGDEAAVGSTARSRPLPLQQAPSRSPYPDELYRPPRPGGTETKE